MSMSKLKKSLLIFLGVFVVLVIAFLPKMKKNLDDEKYYDVLRKAGIVKRCYHPNDTDFITLLSQEKFDYQSLNQEIVKSSLNTIDEFLANKNLDQNLTAKISTVSHHVYFTTNDNVELASYYIVKMLANFEKLNSTNLNWKHYIWTNRPDLFPENLKKYPGVEVKSPSEFDSHPLSKKLKKAIDQGQKAKSYFAEAADLMRLLAVENYGGIYNDMDYEIYDAKLLYSIMQNFDFIAGRETLDIHSYYGNAFFGAKPHHPILVEALRRVERNFFLKHTDKSIPEYLRYPCREYDRIYFDGPPVITMSYFSKNNQDGNKDLILPPWMVFNVNFIRFKNEFCDYKKIKDIVYLENDKNLDKIKQLFINHDVFVLESVLKYSKSNSVSGADLKIRMSEQNIYYSFKYRNLYPIMGADMFCGAWTADGKSFKMIHYWSFWDK